MSFAQARLWILDRFQPNNPTYNIPAVFPLQGALDSVALHRSLNEIIRRHEALRTTFVVIDGKPAQVVSPSLEIELDIKDLRNLAPAVRDKEMNAFVYEESRRPFDLATGPLFRASLLKLTYGHNLLVMVIHHIVSDGWSMSVLYRELSALYMAFVRGQPTPLPELPIQYADFAAWQAEWFRGKVLQRQLDYWKKQLAGLRPVLDLPTDRPRPPVQTNNGAVIGFTLDHKLSEELKSLSQRQGATLFMTLLAAFKSLLHRLSGETDIAVGSPIANRTRSELEGLIGFFVNTLVLRSDLSGDCSFAELMKRVRETALGAYANQDMPFEKLVEELQPERDLTHNPLFQILFAVQNIGTVDRSTAPILPSGIDLRAGAAGNGTAKFDLTMSLLDTGAGARGFLEYNTDLFDAASMEELIQRYVSLLQGVVLNPDVRLSRLPIWTRDEIEEPAAPLVGPERSEILIESIGSLVARHAAQAPDSLAAITLDAKWTYAELNSAANRLARALRSMDIATGATIAIAMAPGIDALLGALAVLKAGYVWMPVDLSDFASPIDPSDARTRLARAIGLIRPACVIAADEVDFINTLPAVAFSTLQAKAEVEADDDLNGASTPQSPAMCFAAADASGELQTFVLTHEQLCFVASDPELQLHATDRVANLAYAASDRARYELIGALVAGAAVVFAPRGLARGSRRFASFLRDGAVTVLFADLVDIAQLAREFPWALRTVRLLLCDESRFDWQKLKEAIRSEILERMCFVWGDPRAGGYYVIQPLKSVDKQASTISIERPAAGIRLWILDKNLDPAPRHVAGNVYIESSAATATSIGYPTGDVARQERNRRLIFRPGCDSAIMLSGFKVYPVEIEVALREHAGVLDAAVAARCPQGLRGRGLVVFVQRGPDATLAEIKEFLAARLPEPLIPSAFADVDVLPRTADGGLDRRALVDMAAQFDEPQSVVAPYLAPRDNLETALAQIWMDVLNVDRVGVHDNFFRLGGHSLIATQMVARISDAFKIEFPLQNMFEAPTIEQIANMVRPLISAGYEPEIPPLVPIPRNNAIPLSFAQQRLWFLDQFEPGSALYNIALPLRVSFAMDASLTATALNNLIARHESLRTTFDVEDGQPIQIIAPFLKISIPVHDLRNLSESARSAEAERLTALEAQMPFDLKRGPILRARLVRLGDANHLLLLTVHHIAADGWSIDILFRELFAFYEAAQTGKPAALPSLGVQYADFASWQRRWLSGTVLQRQVSYWARQLEGAPPLLELPTDRPRPAVQTFSGKLHVFVMPPSLLQAVKAISEREQVTLFTTLLAAFYVLLYRYTGREDLVVGTPIANRVRPELEGLIGFFANTLVLRTKTSASIGFRELMGRVRDVAVGAYAHQDIPFEKLVEELQPQRNLSYNPLFQVMFALQNTSRPQTAGAIPDESTPMLGSGVAKFDLTIFVTETVTDLRIGIEFNSDLFDTATIERLCRHYKTLLSAATEEPEQPIGLLPMLSPEENLSLAEWNDTARPVNLECVHRLFERQVEIAPDLSAMRFERKEISYRELNNRANGWAHRLLEIGVKPGSRVAIFMKRSVEMIAAVLATLKAGAAYVPVDPNYPQERVEFMIADSGAAAIFTQAALVNRLESSGINVLTMDNAAQEPCDRIDNPQLTISGMHPAYVIYTSGSTGRPKGVVMPHGPLASLTEWQIARSGLGEAAPTLQFASLSFDVSFQEIFSTLCARGVLVMPSEEPRRDPRALWSFLAQHRVQRLFLPYVVLQQLAAQVVVPAELPTSLIEVVTAGEQLNITPQIATLFEHLGATLYNQYGPTESHVVAEFKLAGPPAEWPASPPIGRPIPNATLQIIDSYGQACPIGVPGELHIGGAAIAQAYLDRPELTAERFVPDAQELSPGSRLYRTGDRARFLPNGDIQFLGRIDDQVKIRGYRVEPGEIEAVLRSNPNVLEAVVVPQEETGELRLVAFVQVDPKNPPAAAQLRQYLVGKLPEHMVPVRYQVMTALPLTPSGKLSRRDLPASFNSPAEREGIVAPRTPIEEALAQIWCDVLQLTNVGIQDNFFELGGHSLLATRVISRIRDEFQADFSVRRIFEAPTIGELALSVLEAALEGDKDGEISGLLAELEEMPEHEARILFDNRRG